jgi:iron(III) transport system substrate-binding protein
MKKYLIVFAALAVTILIPFVLRPAIETVVTTDNGILTIISPHVESIRSEFTKGFQRYMSDHYGRSVDIQWLTPGGTSEIDKYVDTEYRAVFESYWRKTQLPTWEPVKFSSTPL